MWETLSVIVFIYLSIVVSMYLLHQSRVQPFYSPPAHAKHYPINYYTHSNGHYLAYFQHEILMYYHFLQVIKAKYVTAPINKLYCYINAIHVSYSSSS